MGQTARASTVASTYLDEQSQKALIDRLKRIEGHVRGIQRMVQNRDWADEILLQVAAVKGALNRFAATLLEDELSACLACADDPLELEERTERLTRIMATMLKQS
jgi:DNA-binding FrmR family transcriptional regulator